MLKSEAEQMIRRTVDEAGVVELTDEQIALVAQIIMKLTSRMIEDALSNASRPSGGKPNFFSS